MYINSYPEVLPLLDKILTPYLSGIDGTLAKYRECGEIWRAAGMVTPSYVFGATSSYLVALIVLLRLLMVKRPMSYQSIHKSVSRIGCIVIWVFSLLVSSVYFIVHLPFFDASVREILNAIQNYGLLTTPILLTVVLYVMLICFLKTRTAAGVIWHEANIKRLKALAKMTHGVVAGLIICNVPGLMYNAYIAAMIRRGRGDDIFKSNISV